MAEETQTPSTDTDNPGWFAHDAAFGMPEGSVRAMLALIMVTTMGALYALYKWCPPDLVAFVGLIVGFYFGQASQTTRR